MSCCQRNAGMDPGLYSNLDSKYNQLQEIYPGTSFACVLTPSGDRLWKKPEEGPCGSERLILNIAQLKRASTDFASTLQQVDCNIIHVTGETHIVSCVNIGANLLAFITDMDADELRSFDVPGADSKLKELITDVNLLLQGIVPISSLTTT
mmetsp:Transcript_35258/g.60980  ORF Transcript_35258/g.60980 Transcript_35258/m.60980 type:complete len:151 (+) Transcript_35258:84-536(+)